MAKLTLSVRIGRGFKNQSASFDSRVNPAVKIVQAAMGSGVRDRAFSQFQKTLAEELIDAGRGVTQATMLTRVERAVGKIDNAIRTDIDQYVYLALKFFFAQRSSTAGTDLRISLSDMARNTSGFTSSLTYKTGKGDFVFWAPLARTTIKRKKGNNRYFVNKGNLKSDLSGMLPRFFQSVLNPHIRVTYFNDREKTKVSRRKTKFMSIEAVVATSGAKGMAPSNVAFLSGDIMKPTKRLESNLLRQYLMSQIKELADDVVVKLENAPTRRDPKKKKRPWLEPMMSYWVLKRFPAVLEKSLKEHVLKGMT